MNQLKNLQDEAQKLRLSDKERAVMRAQIFDRISPLPSEPVRGYAVSHFHFFSVRFAPAMAVTLIVLLGGGTAYAAQGALPDELLYPVKVNVNERVELALARTPEAKIETEVRLAERRVTEAEELEATGRLNVAITAELEMAFEAHVGRALALADTVSDEDESEEGAEEERGAVVTRRSQESAEISTTMALKVAENAEGEDSESATATEATLMQELVGVVTDMGTSTGTTTSTAGATSTEVGTSTEREAQKWSRSDWFRTLEEKRETWRELRLRAERRGGEVRGLFDEREEDEIKKEKDDDEHTNSNDGKDGEDGEDGKDGKDGKDGSTTKSDTD